LSWLQTSSQEGSWFSSLRKGRRLKMGDIGRHFDTEKKSSSGSNRDFTRRRYEERSESQHRGEKRNSATSSSQEAGRPKASSSDLARDLAKRNSATSSSQEAGRSKASSSDLVRKLDKLHMSKRTEHQRPSGQRPTGTKFSREISRATSSSSSGRDTRGQRKYDPLLRTQGRRLRGGADPDETSALNVTDEELAQFDRIRYNERVIKDLSKEHIEKERERVQKEHTEELKFKPEDFYKTPDLNK
jgi:hypothetical protein